MGQCRKWALHHRGYLLQLQLGYGEPDTAYAIGVPQCSDDITLVVRGEALTVEVTRCGVVDVNRKGRPAAQILPDRRSVRADELEVETAWGRKYDLTPSAAYVCQSMPFQYRTDEVPSRTALRATQVKYFQQDFVRQRADR